MRMPLRSRLARRRPAPPAAPDPRERVERALTLHRTLVPTGGLVFDVGANVGDRTAIFFELGAFLRSTPRDVEFFGDVYARRGP